MMWHCLNSGCEFQYTLVNSETSVGLPGQQKLYVRRSHMRPEPHHDELHTFRRETEPRRYCRNEGWIRAVAESHCSSVLHRAGPPASGWQLSARTCNFVTSRPYWPATFCLVAMSTTMSIWTRVVTCHRLDGSIVFLVDAQNLPSTNLSGSLKGVIFPRPVVRPTPGYRFYIQSICVSMVCNEQAMLSS